MKFSLANRPIFPQKSNERSVYSCMLFAIVAKELIDINSKKGSNWSFTVQIAHNNKKIIVPRDERIKSLYKDEEKLNIRSCFENPDVKKVYSEYLGKPLSEKSEKLLHTKYYDKSNLLNKETVEVK